MCQASSVPLSEEMAAAGCPGPMLRVAPGLCPALPAAGVAVRWADAALLLHPLVRILLARSPTQALGASLPPGLLLGPF